MAYSYQTVLAETRDRVLHLTLNRPEKLNAISNQLFNDLLAAVQEAEEDANVGVVVIKGAGRAFCAGYDITPDRGVPSSFDRGIRGDIARLERRGRRYATLWNLNKPVIAQVHGYCVAGGTDLAQHCDLVIVAEDAQIGFPAVRSMGSAPTHMWTYNVGPQWAKYILLSGDLIDGKTAERIRFAFRAVPLKDLPAEVHRVASRLAMIDGDLLAANKGIVNKAVELMGRTMMQQMAAENDGIAHKAPAVEEFNRIARSKSLKDALEWRDAKFRET